MTRGNKLACFGLFSPLPFWTQSVAELKKLVSSAHGVIMDWMCSWTWDALRCSENIYLCDQSIIHKYQSFLYKMFLKQDWELVIFNPRWNKRGHRRQRPQWEELTPGKEARITLSSFSEFLGEIFFFSWMRSYKVICKPRNQTWGLVLKTRKKKNYMIFINISLRKITTKEASAGIEYFVSVMSWDSYLLGLSRLLSMEGW